MGFDFTRNGPNTVNCHPALFCSGDVRRDLWRGAKDARIPHHIPSQQIIKYIEEKERRGE